MGSASQTRTIQLNSQWLLQWERPSCFWTSWHSPLSSTRKTRGAWSTVGHAHFLPPGETSLLRMSLPTCRAMVWCHYRWGSLGGLHACFCSCQRRGWGFLPCFCNPLITVSENETQWTNKLLSKTEQWLKFTIVMPQLEKKMLWKASLKQVRQ